MQLIFQEAKFPVNGPESKLCRVSLLLLPDIVQTRVYEFYASSAKSVRPQSNNITPCDMQESGAITGWASLHTQLQRVAMGILRPQDVERRMSAPPRPRGPQDPTVAEQLSAQVI